ncbi:hypothetical protein ACIOKD_25135 [Streptomyces sp. NPDC087844]|uniref:hypothetical protein n=1 Tax=Streptomyces sp. NPDC087844 TaxID=3365805 RepID=UPI0037F7DCA3
MAGLFVWGPIILAAGGEVLLPLGIAVAYGTVMAMFALLERRRQRRLVREGVWDGVHARPIGWTRAMDKRRIHSQNLRPLCEVLAYFAERDFVGTEWEVVEAALPGTNIENNTWYSHRIAGPRRTFILRIAAIPNSGDTFVEIYGVLGGRGKFMMVGILLVLDKYRVS